MAFMKWTEKLSVGVSVLDADHKQLVALINELFDAMQAGQARDKLGQVLNQLVTYTNVHFAREEEYFVQTGYPATEHHKREHEALTRQVFEVQQKYAIGDDATLHLEVLYFLKQWLLNHIQDCDQSYSAHLKANGIC